MFPPERIVRLTEETVETLYLSRRAASHRRHLRLLCAAARGAAGQATDLGLHLGGHPKEMRRSIAYPSLATIGRPRGRQDTYPRNTRAIALRKELR